MIITKTHINLDHLDHLDHLAHLPHVQLSPHPHMGDEFAYNNTECFIQRQSKINDPVSN
jgi:hypothetical protein